MRWIFEDRGSVIVWTSLALIPLFGLVGVSVDSARGYLVKSRLSQAVDAAALAGGKTLTSGDYNADIHKYFNVNFPSGYLGSSVATVLISVDTVNDRVTVSASASVPTIFARIINHDSMQVSADATVQRSIRGMELALVLDNTGSMRSGGKMDTMKAAAADMVDILYGNNETIENFWVSVVPYVSTVNIGPHRTDWLLGYVAANYSPTTWKGCVEARIAPADQNDDPPSISLFTPYLYPSTLNDAGCTRSPTANPNCDNDWPRVPTVLSATSITRSGSTATVNLSAEHKLNTGQQVRIQGADQSSYNGTKTITVTSTTAFTFNVSGSPSSPATGPYTVTKWWNVTLPVDETNGAQNNGYGPNLGCGPEILSLVASKTDVQDKITEMQPWHRGGTMSNQGLVWGWHTISPRWQGLWGGDTPVYLPLDYYSENMDKVVVLMTDGVNELYDNPPAGPYGSDYTAYRRLNDAMLGTTNIGTARTTINTRMSTVCSNMKSQGIIIYTMVFQENNAATQTLFRNCATKPEYFFNAPDNATLTNAFREIGHQLSNLRLAE